MMTEYQITAYYKTKVHREVFVEAENEELKRKLGYCEHEHFLDRLGSSNKWFGMGGF